MFLGGIILFNPDIKRLKENIDAIINQVDKIVCVDNASDNILEIKKILVEYKNIILLENDKNKGIATALNQVFEWGIEQDYNWILTLDQDSVCPNNLIEEYSKCVSIDKLAILTPVICDRNYEKAIEKHGEFECIDQCITSGSLTNVAVWKEVGKFTDVLFIDYVDFDFCKKVQEHNYKIVRVNTVSLLHEIGKGERIKFFNRNPIIQNHSAFRKYYIIRNRLYYISIYKNSINFKLQIKNLMEYVLKVVLFEEQKYKKVKAMIKGAIDSRKLIKNYKEKLICDKEK